MPSDREPPLSPFLGAKLPPADTLPTQPSWNAEKARARRRDAVPEKTVLYWKLYDGGIVEAKSAGSSLNYLLSSRGAGAPEEPPRVMELFDVIRTIKFIEQDDRVVSPTKSLSPGKTRKPG